MNDVPTTVFDDSLSDAKQQQLLAAAKANLLASHEAFSVVDLDQLTKTVTSLQAAFPDHFLHTFAIKANFYLPVLNHLADLGMGAEVAGPGELELALQASFKPEEMVFDAPVKTMHEITRALKLGMALNIDNFQELERIEQHSQTPQIGACIGFRINPQIGAGSVTLSSTATLTSKFGVGLEDEGNREKLINAYLRNDWLNAIHVHVGSVGCPLELMAKGIRVVVEFAHQINERAGFKKITTVDMGGGLPVSFLSDADDPEFSDYASVLRKHVPDLFSGEFKVITEFGRAVIAKSAYSVARVEYTKNMGGRQIALTHAGAHNMMRIVFQPEVWARRVTALSPSGHARSGERVIQDVAGPCCFAGDIIAHQRPLPLLKPGDAVMVHDTGAYCFSNHFMYNALNSDPVYTCRRDENNEYQLVMINAGEDVEALIENFS
jgi:diaminopimelate decarboxylase